PAGCVPPPPSESSGGAEKPSLRDRCRSRVRPPRLRGSSCGGRGGRSQGSRASREILRCEKTKARRGRGGRAWHALPSRRSHGSGLLRFLAAVRILPRLRRWGFGGFANSLDGAGSTQLEAELIGLQFDVLTFAQALQLGVALQQDVIAPPVDGESLAIAVEARPADLDVTLRLDATTGRLQIQLLTADAELHFLAVARLQLGAALDDGHAQCPRTGRDRRTGGGLCRGLGWGNRRGRRCRSRRHCRGDVGRQGRRQGGGSRRCLLGG